MNCRRSERLLSKQCDGVLSPQEARALEAHLEDCSHCRRRREAFRALRADLRELTEPSPAPGLAHRAVALWNVEKATTSQPRWHWGWRPALASSLAVALLAALGYTLTRHASLTPPPDKKLASEGHPTEGSLAKETEGVGRWALGVGGNPIQEKGERKKEKAQLPNYPTTQLPNYPTPNTQRPTPNARQDDLPYINTNPAMALAGWYRMPPDEAVALAARLQQAVHGGDDFITIPLPRLASLEDRQGDKAAVAAYQKEAEVVDTRLIRKMSLGVKGMAFTDLCKRLSEETGIEFTANRSVGDDKVTLFCKEKPLRDLMRQITRVFGFMWLRTGAEGAYKYELSQDLRSRLLEEEMRNRDRNEALLALDREMQNYRKFLGLSPEQAKALMATSSPEDKKLLESLAGPGWGPVHLYFQLSPDELNTLRNGEKLNYSEQPQNKERALPGEMTSHVLESLGNSRISVKDGGISVRGGGRGDPNEGVPPSEFPGVQARAELRLNQSELGQFQLGGSSGFSVDHQGQKAVIGMGNGLATGISPTVRDPKNATRNAKLARDPALKKRIAVHPESSCKALPDPYDNASPTPKVTTADVLESLHKATGMDILADYYTHLYTPGEVSVQDTPVFDALNRVADTMREHWKLDEGWLQFRSAGFFYDRLKEVPNRLLNRWAAARKQNGFLALEDLIEIAQLSDIQLDAETTTEGARACFHLVEWPLAQNGELRPNLRFLGEMSAPLRRLALTDAGLKFEQMPLAIQQKFIALTFGQDNEGPQPRLEDLTGATLRVVYAPEASAQPAGDAAQLAPVKRKLTFSYTYGGPNTGQWKREIGFNNMSVSGGDGQNRQRSERRQSRERQGELLP